MRQVVSIVLAFLLLTNGQATTWHVDFANGNDSNLGTSEVAAFKHYPKAPQATGLAAIANVLPGDTIRFNGTPGVELYPDGLTNQYSGSAGNLITWDGAGWSTAGTNHAVIDLTKPISTGWTNCASSSEVHGNSHYLKIWRTTLPSDMLPHAQLIQGTNQLYMSQDPNATNALVYDNLNRWYSMTNATRTTFTNAAVFVQSTANYWDGADIAIWCQGNEVEIVHITSLNTTTHAITYSSTVNFPYQDDTGTVPVEVSYFSILNHPGIIDQEGEYAINQTDGLLWVWLPGDVDPNTQSMRYGVEKQGFLSRNFEYFTVQNFIFRGPFGALTDSPVPTGCGIQITGNSTLHQVNVKSNFVQYPRSMGQEPAIRLATTTGTVSDNIVYGAIRSRGVLLGGEDLTVSRNRISWVDGTALYIQPCLGGTVSYNYIDHCNGVHGNGISVYGTGDVGTYGITTRDMYVFGNQVWNTGSQFTSENMTNLYVYNNIFDARSGFDGQINIWQGLEGKFWWMNNISLGGTNPPILRFEGGFVQSTIVPKMDNNVIQGGGITQGSGVSDGVLLGHNDRHNNIYTVVASYQDTGIHYQWGLINNETINTNVNAMFVDYVGGDLTPKPGGPLVDMGFDTTSFGVTQDIVGTARPQGSASDIGPYEMVISSSGATIFYSNPKKARRR